MWVYNGFGFELSISFLNGKAFSRNMKKLFLVVLMLIVLPSVIAMEGHTTLLAVKEKADGSFEGSTADLFLEIRDGSGRVFLDTFPLTKTDTQISMRFAKEVACNFLEKDCGKHDFIYTIRADSPIIAGPSAGAAASTLTAALLEGLEFDPEVAITGTINAGGLIGPVGGVKEKIEAGANAGMKRILIPSGERYAEEVVVNESMDWVIKDDKLRILIKNETKEKKIDLVEIWAESGVEVSEVYTLNDALFKATGKLIVENDKELELDPRYNEIMKKLALDLCSRSNELKKLIEIEDNLTTKGKVAFEEGFYYSSASYCFGANVKYAHLILEEKDLSEDEINESINIIRRNIKKIDDKLEEREKETITDIEAYGAVKERLLEAEDFLKNFDGSLYDIAYASERVYSAMSWYEFFIGMGRKFKINDELLKKSCQNKIAEAEERYQYTTLMYPLDLEDTRKEIDRAYDDLKNESYELCLFKASKAKAETDIILGLIGVRKDQLDAIVERKLDIVKQNIIRETEKDIFPIQSYSYYEYANVLKETDAYSALLYAEYALELANLDLYFVQESDNKQMTWVIVFFVVFVIELVIVGILSKRSKTKKRKSKG